MSFSILRLDAKMSEDKENNGLSEPDDEQVELLYEGAAAWNKWRESHPDVKPNLFGAALDELDLRRANLKGAFLSTASLEDADLRGADLSDALLIEANFKGANLEKANLSGSNFFVPFLPSVPVQPIVLASQRTYAMYEHWESYQWVLTDFPYNDERDLLEHIDDKIIRPAESRGNEQTEIVALREQVRTLKEKLGDKEAGGLREE